MNRQQFMPKIQNFVPEGDITFMNKANRTKADAIFNI